MNTTVKHVLSAFSKWLRLRRRERVGQMRKKDQKRSTGVTALVGTYPV